ncbi:MAG TPA: DUF4112 domain-containing protein [Waterburya sp.]
MSQIPPQSSNLSIDSQVSRVRHLRRLSYWLDEAIRIPGTPYRIGLDPIIDLLPIGGDFVGTAFSIYVVFEAARLGVPRATLGQMVGNIIWDTVIGVVPVLGALADAAWKANSKNIALLEEHLSVTPQAKQQVNWLFLALLIGGLLLFVIGIAALSIGLLRWLIGMISG